MEPTETPAETRGFQVRGLGEIALRCADLPAMAAFYEGVIGLERLRGGDSDPIVFFRIAPGVAGHTTVLALFAAPGGASPIAGPGSSLHHLALSLPADELPGVIAHYERIGQAYRVETFPWIGWRGVFTQDPEGNTVELVGHDPRFMQAGAT